MSNILKTRTGVEVMLPTVKEGAAIDADIAADGGNPEWMVAQEMLKPRGRPRAGHPKERINFRL